MKKRVLIIVISLVLISCIVIPVGAVDMLDYNEGYYYETIYVQNNATGDYGTAVCNAITVWNNGISPRRIETNSVSSSQIVCRNFSQVSSLSDHTDAYGFYYPFSDSLSNCSCHTTSAFYIYINMDKENPLDGSDDMTNSRVKQSVAAHELGHALGLGHIRYDQDYLMHPGRDRDTVYRPSTYEKNKVVYKWVQNHADE